MIYNTTVSQKDRAKILFLSSDEPRADIPAIAKSTDAVVLRMGGMDGPATEMTTMLYWEKDAFQIRCDQAKASGLPVLAQFNLRGGYHLDKQHDYATIDNQTWDKNELILGIINVLRTAAWTPSTLKLDADWKTIHAVVLVLWDTMAKNGEVPDTWQSLTLDNVYKNIIMLQSTNRFPKVPVIVLSWSGFLSKYNGSLQNYLYNRRHALSMALMQPIYETTAGPQLESLQVLWDTYRPFDTFKFTSIPYGFSSGNDEGNVVFHNFTYDRFLVPEIFDSAGVHKPANCALWCDTKVEFYKYLNFTAVTPPPVTPPTDLAALTARVANIEGYLKSIPPFK